MDEAGTQSVNVVTEIGQERDRGRNMKGNIIQEINFSRTAKEILDKDEVAGRRNRQELG